MTAIVLTHLASVLISLALTVRVARTLFRGGALFLVDVPDGDLAVLQRMRRRARRPVPVPAGPREGTTTPWPAPTP